MSDGINKSFRLNIQLENIYFNLKERLLSVPYFTFYNKEFIRINNVNYDKIHDSYESKKNYYIYHNYDFSSFKKIISKNYSFEHPKNSRLIYYISDFMREGHIIWYPNKNDTKLENFFKNYISTYDNYWLERAKYNISYIYSQYNMIFTNKLYG